MCPPPRADTPTNNGALAFMCPPPRLCPQTPGRTRTRSLRYRGSGSARSGDSEPPARERPPDPTLNPACPRTTTCGSYLARNPAGVAPLRVGVRCAPPRLRVPSPRACPPSPRACPLTTRVSPHHARVPSPRACPLNIGEHGFDVPTPRACCRNTGENADTLAALPRVWVRSLGGQRTTGERTTSRPNTQPGLPSHHHLWKLPRSEPSPRRSAARWRSMCPAGTPHEHRGARVRCIHPARAATDIGEHAFDVPTPARAAETPGRTRTRSLRYRGSGSARSGDSEPRRENDLPTQHSTRPALAPPPVEATSLGTQPASLRCALAFDVPHHARVPSPRACPLTTRVSPHHARVPSPRACPLTTRVLPRTSGSTRSMCRPPAGAPTNIGEHALDVPTSRGCPQTPGVQVAV
jgi:hypothetical protein